MNDEINAVLSGERRWCVVEGDCLDVLRGMPDASVDAVVTDPPYGLAFMGKRWDYDVPSEELWAECLRVLKPGGHLLAFAGTRTQHRMAVRIEDAGFEIRDMVAWMYGSGFPKSLDVSKAIEATVKTGGSSPQRQADARAMSGQEAPTDSETEHAFRVGSTRSGVYRNKPGSPWAPTEEAAKRWAGWGTALKPAFEPVTVARKPLQSTVAANVLAHGTGALNVDGCRIGAGGDALVRPSVPRTDNVSLGAGLGAGKQTEPAGRWPANVTLDPEAAAELDRQSGERRGFAGGVLNRGATTGVGMGYNSSLLQSSFVPSHADSGGASRFFAVFEHDAEDNAIGMVKREAWENEGQRPSDQTDSTSREKATSGGTSTDVSGSPTSLRGRKQTARFQKDSRSTTGTKTRRTIASKTCNCSQRQSTSESTRVASCGTECGGSHAQYAESASRSETQTGTSPRKDGHCMAGAGHATSGESVPTGPEPEGQRFLYTSKASTAEREAGLAHRRRVRVNDGRKQGGAGNDNPRLRGETKRANSHCTVKPIALMRWLVRLVTPPGGVVLDPFTGSGTTGIACSREGFRFVGIEREAEYVEIARERIAADAPLLDSSEPEAKREDAPEAAQGELFG